MQAYDFFQSLWQHYIEITPQAKSIQSLFQDAGEEVVNDHVAFRTFANSPISLEKLEPILIKLGYQAYGAFRFEKKHLVARCYKHSNSTLPKVFLSELLTHELSEKSQSILNGYIEQISQDCIQSAEIFWKGRLWNKPSLEEYQILSQESEYAAWLSTIGLGANHFTVSINHLTGFNDIESVNQLLLDKGYTLNSVGGLVKGTPEVFLEQSSTMADKIDFVFADGASKPIPSCFYEFAIRHKQADGTLFDSFIEGNADKIFDSTSQE